MDRILFVDDEPNVLEAIRRKLRKFFAVECASSGVEALQVIERGAPFAVVISDMRMPGMNGAQFLTRVREISPDSVRMILSGQAELESTIAAVNEGHIFRFLMKPCDSTALRSAVESGIRQYRLVLAERELLEKTLNGTVQVLTEILSITNPAAFRRASHVTRYAEALAAELDIDSQWEFQIAAMLSQIGFIALPEITLEKIYHDSPLSDEERTLLDSHPTIAAKLLNRIPRLEGVAEMVARQADELPSGDSRSALPTSNRSQLYAMIIRAAGEFDTLITRGLHPLAAVRDLRKSNALPPQILDALLRITLHGSEMVPRSIPVRELEAGMILDQDVITLKGIRLVNCGQEITKSLLSRLHTIADGVGISEPLQVLVPVAPEPVESQMALGGA